MRLESASEHAHASGVFPTPARPRRKSPFVRNEETIGFKMSWMVGTMSCKTKENANTGCLPKQRSSYQYSHRIRRLRKAIAYPCATQCSSLRSFACNKFI